MKMNLKIWALLVLVAFVYWLSMLTGCTLPIAKTETSVLAASAGMKLAWGHPDWSETLFKAVDEHLPKLDKAKDIARFCPKYSGLSKSDKIVAWSTLIVGVAKFESEYNPLDKFQEPMPPKGPGTLSQGLFQISVGDSAYHGACDGITKSSLYDPFVNISCAVHMMGRLVERDSVISSGHLGLARYWSVIRQGHHVDEISKIVSQLETCK